MKKKGILFNLLLTILILPTIVFAAQIEVTTDFEGVKTANPGETVTYDIKIKTNEVNATKYKASLVYNEEVLEFVTVTKGEGWNSISSAKKIELSNSKGSTTGTTVVATITFKVKDVAKQKTEIKLTDIEITAKDKDGKENIYANFGEKKETLSIKSTDNSLKDLKIDGITIEDFKSDVYEYELTVDSDIDSIDVAATTNNTNATFVDSYGPRKIDLNYGENDILIKVKSESGVIQVYKISVTRVDDRNTNNNLKEVIINSGKIKLELSKNKVDYVIKTYKLKKLEVDAVAVDDKAEVKVEIPEEIVVGENVVLVTVTSENGEEKIYTITFENSDKKIDTKIKTLYIKGHEIDFDKNTMVYEVVYNKKDKKGLNIKVVTVSNDDIVEYKIYYNGKELKEDSNIKLKPGDKYEIKVMPIGIEEGDESDTTTYVIKIERDKRVSFFLVLELFIIFVLVILIIIQVVKRNKIRKNKNNINKKDDEEEYKEEKVKQEIDKTKVITEEEIEKINNNGEE